MHPNTRHEIGFHNSYFVFLIIHCSSFVPGGITSSIQRTVGRRLESETTIGEDRKNKPVSVNKIHLAFRSLYIVHISYPDKYIFFLFLYLWMPDILEIKPKLRKYVKEYLSPLHQISMHLKLQTKQFTHNWILVQVTLVTLYYTIVSCKLLNQHIIKINKPRLFMRLVC